MNLNEFKILKEDDQNYHVEHPSGRKMVVEKDKLSSGAHKIIQKFAKGGEVQDPYAAVPTPDVGPIPTPVETPAPEAPVFQYEPGKAPVPLNQAAMMRVQQESPTLPQSDGSIAAAPVVQQPDPMAGMNSGYTGQKAAANQLYQAQAQQGADTAKVISEVDKKIEQLPSATDLQKKYEKSDADLYKSYQEKAVDPNRYWGNKSTGQKIGAAIAMIIGGGGAAVSGQQNIAQKMIDDAIERDVQAQKEDQNKSMNLWKMNKEAFKTDMEANLATRNQLYTGLKYKIDLAAANAMSPMAKAAAMNTIAQIDQKIAENRKMMSLINPSRETTGGAPAGSEQAYQSHMNALQMYMPEMAKEKQDKYIPGVGTTKIKPTDKDREVIASSSDIKKDLNELMAIATQGPTVPGSTADAVNKNKIASLQLKLKTGFELGVLSESDFKMLDRLVADPGSFRTDRAIKQLEATKKSIAGKEQSIFSKLGLQPFRESAQNQIIVSNGKQTLKIDPADLEHAKKDGYNVR